MQDGKAGPFANHKDFLEWFSNPMDRAIESGEGIDEETRRTVSRLHTVLRPYLLRRLKADVEKEMPAKYEHIVYCRLSRRQRYLYDDFMSRATTRDTLSSGNFMGVINCLMQLRKVCNHPDLFEVRPISTSFAMERPAAATFTTADLLVRKRLLDAGHFGSIDLPSLNLVRTGDLADSVVAARERVRLDATRAMPKLVPPKVAQEVDEATRDLQTEEGWRAHLEARRRDDIVKRVQRMVDVNHRRCAGVPLVGSEIISRVQQLGKRPYLMPTDATRDPRIGSDTPTALPGLVSSYSQQADKMRDVISRYAFATPMALARDLPDLALPGLTPEQLLLATEGVEEDDAWYGLLDDEIDLPTNPLQLPTVKLSIAFPDRSLLQYDCGKLQKLYELLQGLVAGGHRALIFTQMTKVLDILETFLSFHGWRYLRLDGSTKVEDRQIITERFNRDTRILCFISSTRAGGLGINLTGADTVVFYDSDWCAASDAIERLVLTRARRNPSMDRQCQDRAHRIGQTRDVHIYRFVSEATIEENVLKKCAVSLPSLMM
jgi:helicase SWR1